MNRYFVSGDYKYPATFTGKRQDATWDDRESKTITIAGLDYADAAPIFKDDIHWAIVEESTYEEPVIDPETGEVVIDPETGDPKTETKTATTTYDNSAFSMFGSLTQTFDGQIIAKMGKPTELEEAYELLYGGM